MATIINLVLFIFVTYLLTFGYSQNQYCNLASCKGKGHSMCIYSTSPSSQCGQCYQVGLTQNEKNEILNIHNQLRNQVSTGRETRGSPGPQPAAARGAMKTLSWNNELERIAQRWANQCQRGHDGCRDTPTTVVGQNAASQGNSDPSGISISRSVYAWYNEVELFDRNIVNRYRFDSRTGHYTQMVWGDTQTIGCGYVKCLNGNMHRMNLICNYGPSGNYRDRPVYRT